MIDNPLILFFVGLTAVISAANTGLMLFNALKAASMLPTGVTAPVIIAGMLALQAATALAFYSQRQKDTEALQDIAIADNGMMVGARKYDSGGHVTASDRHQMVFVEPGETIIPKTQNMLGSGGITVNVGDVYAQDGTDFAEKLADALPFALRTVSDRGGI